MCKDSTADICFLEFWGIHWVRGQTVYKNVGLGWFGVAFWLLQAKSCRIIMKLHQTVYIRNVTVLMKSWNLDMSGPAKASPGGQVLVSDVGLHVSRYLPWEVLNLFRQQSGTLLTRTCPPGLASAGPDMTEARVLIEFRTFRVQN